ncbi:IS3 family transposase [Faecalicoccus acidiformans]
MSILGTDTGIHSKLKGLTPVEYRNQSLQI